ncbi:hypothetical protein ACODT5_28830 [Streptomyces sp. 5.8]|uniref:hypothetical protein n=1 Tax=Streptomyces sp. 5.8 TaxID=3406571 RepID=UPI003BB7F373
MTKQPSTAWNSEAVQRLLTTRGWSPIQVSYRLWAEAELEVHERRVALWRDGKGEPDEGAQKALFAVFGRPPKEVSPERVWSSGDVRQFLDDRGWSPMRMVLRLYAACELEVSEREVQRWRDGKTPAAAGQRALHVTFGEPPEENKPTEPWTPGELRDAMKAAELTAFQIALRIFQVSGLEICEREVLRWASDAPDYECTPGAAENRALHEVFELL